MSSKSIKIRFVGLCYVCHFDVMHFRFSLELDGFLLKMISSLKFFLNEIFGFGRARSTLFFTFTIR